MYLLALCEVQPNATPPNQINALPAKPFCSDYFPRYSRAKVSSFFEARHPVATWILSPEVQPPDTQRRYPCLMLLSFVVPAYNEEAYLGACLDSIFDQTRGLEHLSEI